MRSLLFFSALLITGIITSCNNDDCDTTDVTYTKDVASIFNTSCAVSGCHVDGNESNAFFSLEGYEKSKTAASFGRIVGAISHDEDYKAMPYGGEKLDQCSIDKISAWITAGTPE